MSNREFLVYQMEGLGLSLTGRQIELFEMFYEDLVDKNRVMNLTAITEWEDAVLKHFVDSLAIVKICDMFQQSLRVIDVGTGAGFPGIPLAILFPEIDILMIDSVGKKITFLNEEIQKLGLSRAWALHGRVEDLARQSEYREQFDLCVSRAVANLSTLSEYCLPFVRPGGSFVAYKSGNCQGELDAAEYAIRQLSGEVKRIEKYQIEASFNDENSSPSDEKFLSRTLIEITKVGTTRPKYPRRAGIPAKTPLSV